MIHVVLGMHKSGTTLASRLLHESGVPMVEVDRGGSYDEGNQFERRAALAINHRLLAGRLRDPLVARLRRGRIHRDPTDRFHHSLALPPAGALETLDGSAAFDAIRAMVASCDAHPEWGFKDARTCLTYEAWRAALPEHRLILVYRGYGQLLRRYGVAGVGQLRLFRLHRVLSCWALYNGRALRAIESHPGPSIVLSYERLMSGDEELGRLERFLDRALVDVRRPHLFRHRDPSPPRLPAAVRLALPRLGAQARDLLQTLEEARRPIDGRRAASD